MHAQRLLEADVGDHHVAIVVGETEFAVGIGVADGLDALIEDLDLLQRLHVVVDDHLLAADDGDAPLLRRIEPAGADVGQHVVGEHQGGVGHILDALLHARGAVGVDADRVGVEQKAQDGDVVGGQVPDDVGLGLEEAQAGADGVDVVDVAQLAAADHLFDGSHGRIVFEGMADHEHAVVGLGHVDQPLGVVAIEGDGLLDQDVEAVLHTVAGDGVMGGRRRGNDHGVQVEVEQVTVVGGRCLDLREALHHAIQRLRLQVGHGDDDRAGDFDKIAN